MMCRLVASLSEAMFGLLPNVVHQAIQLPLRIHLGLILQREAIDMSGLTEAIDRGE